MRMQRVGAGLIAVAVVGGVLGTQPAVIAGQGDAKAADVLASARKAIGGRKLEGLTSLGVQAALQRNVNNFQVSSDVELLVEMPDKYMRSESSGGGIVNMASTLGFNGNLPLKAAAQPGIAPGGGMVIRIGGPAGPSSGPDAMGGGEKPTPVQQQEMRRLVVRSSRHEISRLMLGWLGMAHPSLNAHYTYAGEAESPDGKAYVIDVKNADGFAARLFIDEKTHLPLMLTYQAPQPRVITMGAPRPPGGGAQPQAQTRPLTDEAQKQIQDIQRQPPAMVAHTLYFEDWREVDGIRFPHALRRASAGATTEEWTINKVRVNPRIDPKKFETEG